MKVINFLFFSLSLSLLFYSTFTEKKRPKTKRKKVYFRQFLGLGYTRRSKANEFHSWIVVVYIAFPYGYATATKRQNKRGNVVIVVCTTTVTYQEKLDRPTLYE